MIIQRMNGLRVLKSEKGMILLATLLVLAAVSLIAVGLSHDTTVSMQMASNKRQYEQLFQLSDGALDLGIAALRDYLYTDIGDASKYFPSESNTYLLIDDLTLAKFSVDPGINDDILDPAGSDNYEDPENNRPDISFTLSSADLLNSEVYIDIDRLHLDVVPGSAAEQASGYDGAGYSIAHGGTISFYSITSHAVYTDTPAVAPRIGTVYGKVNISVDE